MASLRSFATVSGLTLVSRVLGFVRDALILRYLGASPTMDVWSAAFRLPNLFRRVFGEGAFNAAFIPLYSRKLEEEGEEAADAFAAKILGVLIVLLSGLAIGSWVFMRKIVWLLNLGYSEEKLALTTDLSRITVVYLVFICLVAAVSGVLNSRRQFFAPAFAYVALNIVFLIGLVFVVPKTGAPADVLAWSLAIGGVVQLAIVVISARRNRIRTMPSRPRLDADTKGLAILMGPGLVSAGVQQLNLMVGAGVASFMDGAQSFIYTADRINQLPMGLIGSAFGVVLLPEITRAFRGGDPDGARAHLDRAVTFSLLLGIPAMVAMIVIPNSLISGIFRGGEFTAEHAHQTSMTLAAFGFGAPAYILVRVLQTGYFAREDTQTPMRFTMVSAVVNIVLCLLALFLIGKEGPLHLGCAAATTVAGWVNVILLTLGLSRKGFLDFPPTFWSRAARMIVAAIVMGGAIYLLAKPLHGIITEAVLPIRLLAVGALCGVGAVVYFAAAIGVRATSIGELKAGFRRS